METGDLTPILELLVTISDQQLEHSVSVFSLLRYIADYGLYLTVTSIILIFLLGLIVGVLIIKR